MSKIWRRRPREPNKVPSESLFSPGETGTRCPSPRGWGHRPVLGKGAPWATWITIPASEGAQSTIRSGASNRRPSIAHDRTLPNDDDDPTGDRDPGDLDPWDGIGPEIVTAAVEVLEAAGGRFEWDVQLAGMEGLAKAGDPLPEATIESIRRTRLGSKAP